MRSINTIQIGERFGTLTVLREVGPSNTNLRQWLCACDCGNETTVTGTSLCRGATKSCGCGIGKKAREFHTKHGGYKAPEYQIWATMRDRCNNPNNTSYANYGGRGIRVCERWESSYANFIADMGPRPSPRHSIDRRDNGGDYTPENCYWATVAEQSRNKRVNHYLTLRGETKTLTDWCRELGLDPKLVSSRLRAGWDTEKALTTPPASRVKR